MKRVCTFCNVISDDFNLWCQEKHCPAENAHYILDNGEWFGPIQIIEPLAILRSATIYRAQREKELVLLKIASPGCEDKLRREAQAFLQLAQAGQHPLLPILLSAHIFGRVADHPYGWTVIKGERCYYSVFANVEGENLRGLLMKNPQPWYIHAAWITLEIADVICYLHQGGNLHLCLSPDVVLVRFDRQGIPRPTLLDLGIGYNAQNLHDTWKHNYNAPAYTPPEVFTPGVKVDQRADVYGVGLLFYEMLAGRPAHSSHLKRENLVIRDVRVGTAPPIQRDDLRNLPQLAEKAIQRNPSQRPMDLKEFSQHLAREIPKLKPEKRSLKNNRLIWRVFFIIVGLLLTFFLLFLLALALMPSG